MKLSDFFAKLGVFRRKNEERIRTKDAFRDVGNGYFQKISQYFKTAEIVLFLLLFLFVTSFVILNSRIVTYENLYYFFQDFRIAVDNTDSSVDAIPYATDSNVTFSLYKGGLAVAGSERLQLLTAAGGVNHSASLGFAAPGISASTDLVLVYARGEKDCHVYNSFTKIHEETLDGNIRTAYLSESGAYSVTTEDEEYESAVYVYSRNFKKLNKYELNSYVIASPISEDGKNVAILSYVCKDGIYETRVRLARVGSGDTVCDTSMKGEFPLGIAFNENGGVLLLTEKALYRIDKKGGVTPATEWTDQAVGTFCVKNGGAVLAFQDRNENKMKTIAVSDEDGAILRYIDTEDAVLAVERLNDYVFYRTDNELVRVSVKTGEEDRILCEQAGGDFLAFSEDTVLICKNGEAKYYRFP